MKYCNNCFRNIWENVAKCPYCNRSDGLKAYDTGNEKPQERKVKKSDSDSAYKRTDEGKTDAYGSKKHKKDCDNAPEEPKKAMTELSANGKGSQNNGAYQKALRINAKSFPTREAYMKALSQIPGLSIKETAQLMKRYDSVTNQDPGSKKVNFMGGNPQTSVQRDSMGREYYAYRKTTQSQDPKADKSVEIIIYIIIAFCSLISCAPIALIFAFMANKRATEIDSSMKKFTALLFLASLFISIFYGYRLINGFMD